MDAIKLIQETLWGAFGEKDARFHCETCRDSAIRYAVDVLTAKLSAEPEQPNRTCWNCNGSNGAHEPQCPNCPPIMNGPNKQVAAEIHYRDGVVEIMPEQRQMTPEEAEGVKAHRKTLFKSELQRIKPVPYVHDGPTFTAEDVAAAVAARQEKDAQHCRRIAETNCGLGSFDDYAWSCLEKAEQAIRADKSDALAAHDAEWRDACVQRDNEIVHLTEQLAAERAKMSEYKTKLDLALADLDATGAKVERLREALCSITNKIGPDSGGHFRRITPEVFSEILDVRNAALAESPASGKEKES